MDAVDFTSCLGKTNDTKEITGMLSSLGVTKQLKASRDGDLQLELPKTGIILSFELKDRKSSVLQLIGVQFYTAAQGGFTTFAGPLPKGLTFADSPKEVLKKLGKPTSSKKQFRIEHWLHGSYQLSVQYTKSNDAIALVLLSLLPGES